MRTVVSEDEFGNFVHLQRALELTLIRGEIIALEKWTKDRAITNFDS